MTNPKGKQNIMSFQYPLTDSIRFKDSQDWTTEEQITWFYTPIQVDTDEMS